MQGTQYATKRSILCRGAFCGPTAHISLRGCAGWSAPFLFEHPKKTGLLASRGPFFMALNNDRIKWYPYL